MYVKVYKNWPCTYLRTSSPGGTGVAGSSQESLRHMRKSAYRCFLPDLTGFTGSHCAGPNLQRYPRQPDPKEERPRISFNPAVADCGLQGTAISPSSTAKLQTSNLKRVSKDTDMAEGVGFEPTRRLRVYTLSRRAPSAARTSLHVHMNLALLYQLLWRRGWDSNPRGAHTPTRFRGGLVQPLRHPSP